MILSALRRSASLDALGPQRLRAAVEFFQPSEWEVGQVVLSQGDTQGKLSAQQWNEAIDVTPAV